jgi:hypothetical protein
MTARGSAPYAAFRVVLAGHRLSEGAGIARRPSHNAPLSSREKGSREVKFGICRYGFCPSRNGEN